MRMKKLIRKTDQHAIDWGYVIGYINHGECPQSLGRQPQIKLEIGSEGDITALSALRPDALDSLIFYSDK